MTDTKPEVKRVPAAFINVIAEDGTKAEAIKYLQKTWDERCWFEEALNRAERDHAAKVQELESKNAELVRWLDDLIKKRDRWRLKWARAYRWRLKWARTYRDLEAARRERDEVREENAILTKVLEQARSTLFVSIKAPEDLQASLGNLNLVCLEHYNWRTEKIRKQTPQAGKEG